MPTLTNYTQFAGRHYETGTVHNFLAYQNVNAPHTNQPYSEAMLMGVSGGLVFGYFSFAYDGYDPHVALLTRNTFDPLNTMLSRLGIVQEVRQTAKAEKGVANLVDTLNDGLPAIVWADMWSMSYNGLDHDEGMWGILPLIVYGYEEETDQVFIADRASVPLTVTTETLAKARGRIKKDKFRVMTLDTPDADKLPSAATAGIWDTIKLFTEKPPKGSKKNFGLAAYKHWIDLLTKPKQRLSWAKEFPAGVKMYAGLTSAYNRMCMTGTHGASDHADGERTLYADFLDEASVVLKNPQLIDVANTFRSSAKAWGDLADALLPDEIEPLRIVKLGLTKKGQLFWEKGAEALSEIQQINRQLADIRQSMADDFPLNENEVIAHRAAIAERVLAIHDIEAEAIEQLKAAIS